MLGGLATGSGALNAAALPACFHPPLHQPAQLDSARPAPRSLPTAAGSRRSNAAAAAAATAARRAKRKGMSAEEKRQTLLGIFHETKDVFTLKVRRRVKPRGFCSSAMRPASGRTARPASFALHPPAIRSGYCSTAHD